MALGPHQTKVILELGDAEDWVATSPAYTQQYRSLYAKGLIETTASDKHARLTAEGITVYTALKYPGGIAPKPKDQSTAVPAHPSTVSSDGQESEMRELTRHIRLDKTEGELLTKVVALYLPQGLPFYIASRNSCTKYLVSQGLISEKQTEAGVYLYPTLKGAMWAVCNDCELYTPFVQNSHRFQLSVNAGRKLPEPKKVEPSALDTLIKRYGLTEVDLDNLGKFESDSIHCNAVMYELRLPAWGEDSHDKDDRRTQRVVHEELIRILVAPFLRLAAIGLVGIYYEGVDEAGAHFELTPRGTEVWRLL